MATYLPLQPKEYKIQLHGNSQLQTTSIGPYFSDVHPNTAWVLNRLRRSETAALAKVLKSRTGMNLFYKYSYFQIRDRPYQYMLDCSLERPMFNKDAYVFLNIFSLAVYFKRSEVVRTLAAIRVAKADNEASYASLGEANVPLYAAYVHDHSMGDLLTFTLPVLMMRRGAFFAANVLLNFGDWRPDSPFSTSYYRRNYHSMQTYADWMQYAWKLLCEHPCTQLAELVKALVNARHHNFYIGKKSFYQPIKCRNHKERQTDETFDERAVIVQRSYPRRLLCSLFLQKRPEHLLPQAIAFVRVFQRDRFFVMQTKKLQEANFRKQTTQSLEDRFLAIAPICNAKEQNTTSYVSGNRHRMTMYDFDNVVALLVYFLVVASDRHVVSLKSSLVSLIMDILCDMKLVYLFCREPAVHISYYLSHLVDGPMVQPNDLQTLLCSIPVMLAYAPNPHQYFPPALRIDAKETDIGYKLFHKQLASRWKSDKLLGILRAVLLHRIDTDNEVGVTNITHCSWKNDYLTERLRLNLSTIGQTQQKQPQPSVKHRLNADDDGSLVDRPSGWRSSKTCPNFFSKAKNFICCRQEGEKVYRQLQSYLGVWKPEQLKDPIDDTVETKKQKKKIRKKKNQ